MYLYESTAYNLSIMNVPKYVLLLCKCDSYSKPIVPSSAIQYCSMQHILFHNTVVEIGLMQTSYTTSEAMGSVSVCVEISSAQLIRNASVILRSMRAGAAVGKSCNSQISAKKAHYMYRLCSISLVRIKICTYGKRQPTQMFVFATAIFCEPVLAFLNAFTFGKDTSALKLAAPGRLTIMVS